MAFEYDADKSAANQAKHGIDFEAAQALWDDPAVIEAPAHSHDEPRFLVIGRIAGKHWAAVCVHRANAIRLISVRRARQQEIQAYESN